MIIKGSSCIPAILLLRAVSNVALRGRANTVATVIVHFLIIKKLYLIFWTWSSPLLGLFQNIWLQVGNWSKSLRRTTTDSECWTEVISRDSLRTIGRAPALTCTWTEVTGLNLNWWCAAFPTRLQCAPPRPTPRWVGPSHLVGAIFWGGEELMGWRMACFWAIIWRRVEWRLFSDPQRHFQRVKNVILAQLQ